MSDKDLEIKQQIRFSTPADPSQEAATPVPAATVLLVRAVSYTHLTLPTIYSV